MPDVGNILRRILPGPKPEPIRWYDYGVRQQQRGNLEEAVRAYTEALRLDPEMAPAYSNRGSAYLNMGWPDLAIADADEAISREPRQPVAYSVLGNAHHALGKAHQEREEQEQARDEYDQAARYLSQAIRINPRFAGFYSDRGAVHRAAGRLAAAIDDFSQAIRLEKRFPVPYNNRADAYIATGALDLAIRDLNEAVKLDPRFAVAFVNRATARAMMGQREQAQRDINVAVGLGLDRRALEEMIGQVRPMRRRRV